jgi:hypothetical protein
MSTSLKRNLDQKANFLMNQERWIADFKANGGSAVGKSSVLAGLPMGGVIVYPTMMYTFFLKVFK